MDSWEWPLFLLPFWHLSPPIPFSSNVHVLFSCPDCAPNTHLPFVPYRGLCFLSSFQAWHLLTLCVLFCGSYIQTHWSGVDWQVGQVSRVLPPRSLALRGHYAICHGFRTCLSRLREHMAPSCPGGKGQEQHELLDSVGASASLLPGLLNSPLLSFRKLWNGSIVFMKIILIVTISMNCFLTRQHDCGYLLNV